MRLSSKDQDAIAKLYIESFDWDNPYKDDVKNVRRRQMSSDTKDYGRDAALNSSSFKRDRPEEIHAHGEVKYDRPPNKQFHSDSHNTVVRYQEAPQVFDAIARELGISKNDVEVAVQELAAYGNDLSSRIIAAEDDDINDWEETLEEVLKYVSKFVKDNY